jgi:hypothetical protein
MSRLFDMMMTMKMNPYLARWRSGILLLSTAVFVLVIPSLPVKKYHLVFWAAALIIEISLIVILPSKAD